MRKRALWRRDGRVTWRSSARAGYSHSALDTPARQCRPDEEDDAPRASFGGMKRSSEAAMLGVFGDSDSDTAAANRSGRKASARRHLQANGRASDVVCERRKAGAQGGAGGADDSAAAAATATSKAEQPARRRCSTPPPLPGEKVDRDFATFEAHGKGFGTRMLEKMGWTKGQGIGKSGHGVVNPLSFEAPPNSMGLGFGGFKETTAKAKLQQERILHADSERAQLSDESDEELARERRRQGLPAKGASSSSSAAGPEPKRQHWKRHERRELQVKSAADLRQQWAQKDAAAAAASASTRSSSATTTTILDMRGPEARVHSSISSARRAARRFRARLERGGAVDGERFAACGRLPSYGTICGRTLIWRSRSSTSIESCARRRRC